MHDIHPAIIEVTEVLVRWTESADEPHENVTMTIGAFRTMLSSIRAEWKRDGMGGYCKVAFLAGGRSFRIDVDQLSASTDLRNAWLY